MNTLTGENFCNAACASLSLATHTHASAILNELIRKKRAEPEKRRGCALYVTGGEESENNILRERRREGIARARERLYV